MRWDARRPDRLDKTSQSSQNQRVRGGLATFARFSVMHGKPNGPMSPAPAQALQSLYDTYDMNKHTQDDSRQAAGLPATFIDHFGIVGPPDICIEKLRSLAALGLDKLFFGVMFRLGADAGRPCGQSSDRARNIACAEVTLYSQGCRSDVWTIIFKE